MTDEECCYCKARGSCINARRIYTFKQIRSDKKYIFDFSMLTLNTILKELRNVPVDKLGDLYSIIHSFRDDTKKSGDRSKRILSFAGSFEDLSDSDYDDFLRHTQQTRADLFDRDISL